MNAHSRNLNYNRENRVGKGLNRFLIRGSLIYLGPNFPTFYGRATATSSDIILGNNKIVHNITIIPGPLTTSDHIPIIMEITTKAITKPITPKLNMKKANWENFTEEVKSKIAQLTLQENMTKEQIDQKSIYGIEELKMQSKIAYQAQQDI